jgi:uncharacterized protein (TIGR04255 family)
MNAQTYRNPPIVEAIFEVQFSEALSTRDVERLRKRFANRYPRIEQQHQVDVEIKPDGSATTKATPIGFKMTSSNAVDILVLHHQRFGTIKTAPYEGWDEFLGTAKANYDEFTKVAGRRTLVRIASRYVNRLDIPSEEIEGVDMLQFLRFGVAMPDEMSKSIGPFSVAANFAAGEVKVLAQCAVIAPVLLNHLSLLFDIDASVDKDIKPHKDAIWEVAERLHKVKNDVFEAGITDRLRERFK